MVKIENKGDYEIHRPPDRLQTKVEQDTGISFDEIEKRSEQNMHALAEKFLIGAADSIKEIKKSWQALAENTGTFLDRDIIFNHCHDLKGMGGSFDYPLISLVGEKICLLTGNAIEVEALNLEFINAHVDILSWSVANHVGSPNDPRSIKLLTALENANVVTICKG
ncbi:hypothetical protein NBZ79_05340 [Sneathiella marina]|uniref:HPt domain-containing protein n=1 Tax=Sneathiella marina TaxID=2950108 RepID=A0ABY4W5U0_9PROT|nr:hypothetical protein [Sneathiella marina]USG62403.1 hypothetical protein NBZ79_05340 [Sneathiella marina]